MSIFGKISTHLKTLNIQISNNMAKIKRIDGSVVVGKVGGLVHKVGPNGAYVQAYRKKRAAKVNSQQYINQFTTLATHWKTLTAIEQFSWEAARFLFPKFKRMSGPIYLTRKQLYMSHGAILMQYCGYDITTLPRTAPTPAPIIPVSGAFLIQASVGLSRLLVNVVFFNGAVNVPTDHVLIIKASMPYPYVSGENPALPCTEFTVLNAGSLVPTYNMFFDYEAKFVTLKHRDLVWFEYFTVHVLTGQVSNKKRLKIYMGL
jgi:hypothetical protein